MSRLGKSELVYPRLEPVDEVLSAINSVGHDDIRAIAADILTRPVAGAVHQRSFRAHRHHRSDSRNFQPQLHPHRPADLHGNRLLPQRCEVRHLYRDAVPSHGQQGNPEEAVACRDDCF